MKKIIAIIFARGGSKGVKEKNIKLINNKPLIAYTIQTALQSKYIDKIYVSTDCDKIASVSKMYGAEIPFKRPSYLAEDNSAELDSWKHSVQYFKNIDNKDFTVIVLPCVTPLKTTQNIDDAIELYQNSTSDLIYTCMESYRNPYFNMVKKNEEVIELFMGKHMYNRRQDAPEVYDLTPAVLITDSKYIEKCNNLFEGNVKPFIITKEEGVDIDDNYDFQLAELLINKNSIDYILCGLGSIGKRHLRNILSSFPNIKIGILRRDKIQDEEFKTIPVFSSFEECLKYNPKAFIICTPTAFHMDIALKCSELNIHTFIEKPLSSDLTSVKEFIQNIKTNLSRLEWDGICFDDFCKNVES